MTAGICKVADTPGTVVNWLLGYLHGASLYSDIGEGRKQDVNHSTC